MDIINLFQKNEVINKKSSKNHVKMQEFVTFCKKKSVKKIENKYVKDKKSCKVRDHCHCTGEYRSAAHIICNLKHNFL